MMMGYATALADAAHVGVASLVVRFAIQLFTTQDTRVLGHSQRCFNEPVHVRTASD
jgi:hypothetical protein